MKFNLDLAKKARMRPFIVPGNYEATITDVRYWYSADRDTEGLSVSMVLEDVEIYYGDDSDEREHRDKWTITHTIAHNPDFRGNMAQLGLLVIDGLGIDGDTVDLSELDYSPLKGRKILVGVLPPRERNGDVYQNFVIREFI